MSCYQAKADDQDSTDEVSVSYYATIGPLTKRREECYDENLSPAQPSAGFEDEKEEVGKESLVRLNEELEKENTVLRQQLEKFRVRYLDAKDKESEARQLRIDKEKLESRIFVLEQHNQSLRDDVLRSKLQNETLVQEKERLEFEHSTSFDKLNGHKVNLESELDRLSQELEEANSLNAYLKDELLRSQQSADKVKVQLDQARDRNRMMEKVISEMKQMEKQYVSEVLTPNILASSSKRSTRRLNGSKNYSRSKARDPFEDDSQLIEAVVSKTVNSIGRKLFP